MTLVRRLAALSVAGALLAFGASAEAGIPLPMWSTVDSRLVLCPAGDLAFHVTPRRGSAPVAGAQLFVYFCDATGWTFDPAAQPATIFFFGTACAPSVFTDQSGLATFALKAGGTTADSTVALYVDGVPFGRRFLASPDQNGDLRVDAADEVLLASKLGTHDLSADFDGDGLVTEADHTIQRAHLGHASEQATSATPASWGRLKTPRR